MTKVTSLRAATTMNQDGVAFLHICKKEKGKAEKQDLEKALSRAKSEGLM